MSVAGVWTIRLLASHTTPALVALAVPVGVASASASVGTLHWTPLNVTLRPRVLPDLTNANPTVAVAMEAVHPVLARSVQLTPDRLLGVVRDLLTLGGDRVLVAGVSKGRCGLCVRNRLELLSRSNNITTCRLVERVDDSLDADLFLRSFRLHDIARIFEPGAVGLCKTRLTNALAVLAITLV